MAQVINAAQRFVPGGLIGPEEEHLYERPRPYSQLFVTCLQAILQTCQDSKARALYLAFNQRPGTVRDSRYVGRFTGRFDGWECLVNWTPETYDNLPPGHIRVQWRDTEVGVLSPFTDGKPVDGTPSINRWRNLVLVSEDDLQEAAAAAITRATKKDRLFAAFHGDEAQDRKRLALEGAT